MGDFGHINNIFRMKMTLFNMLEMASLLLWQLNIVVMTNAYIWHHDVAPNWRNVIPAFLPWSAKITFILPDLRNVNKCTQLFLYDKMIKSWIMSFSYGKYRWCVQIHVEKLWHLDNLMHMGVFWRVYDP